MNKLKLISLCTAAVMTTACAPNYQPLSVKVTQDSFIATGVIDESTPEVLRETIKQNRSIKKLILQHVPGSVDDEANLEIAREVREAGLTTLVPADGVVASGGTDLFLAGAVRKIEAGACLGVHSWAELRGFSEVAGRDVPKEDPVHQLYVSYYKEMDIPVSFYWFTLDAAPVEDIYFVDKQEVNKFKMSSVPLKALDQDTQSQRYQRCIDRLDKEA